jgi:outer membrane lipoprotein-sorting protein
MTTRTHWTTALAAAACLVAAAGARADSRADALIKRATALTAKAKTLQADLILHEQGKTEQAKLRLMKPNLAHIKMLQPSEDGPETVVSDGKTVFIAGNAMGETLCARMPAPPRGLPFLASSFDVDPIAVFFEPQRLQNGATRTYVGTQKVGGRSYQVVRLTARARPEQLLYIGASGLIEGWARARRQAVGEKSTAAAMWLHNTRANAPMPAGQFTYTPPERGAAPREQPGSPYEQGLVPVGQKAPPFALPALTGNKFALSDALKGKRAVLVNFWFYG